MGKVKQVLCLGVALFAGAPCLAADHPLEGTYLLSYYGGATANHLLLIKFESKDGKPSGTVVSVRPGNPGLGLGGVTLYGNTLRLQVTTQGAPYTFEGTINQSTVLGSLANDSVAMPASLAKSDLEKIDGTHLFSVLPGQPVQKAVELSNQVATLYQQARGEKDEAKKDALTKKAREASAAAQKEYPKLYREIMQSYADGPAVFYAGLNLLRDSNAKATPEEIRKWSGMLTDASKLYGPRYELEIATQLTEILSPKDEAKDLALKYAEIAMKAFTPKTALETQERLLKLYAVALRKNDKAAEVKEVETRLAELGGKLDREYLAKMPPFTPAEFAGRKTKTDRVVLMELFTGAQCGPCVAADAAFDALEKTYKPTELVVLQYHMHIPRPDALTNPDTVARMQFYSDKFPANVAGTPSTVFNGAPKAGGGGGLDNAEKKYKEYREVIDPLLEEIAPVRLTATANRQGNRIEMKAEVGDLLDAGDGKRLRFVLVEERVHYVGSNKMRYHHHVVRAFPGGLKGMALKERNSQHSAAIDVDELRQQLVKYLDESGSKNPFPIPDRPLDLKNLKVVAFVQDDSTGQILQAAQVNVTGEPGAE